MAKGHERGFGFVPNSAIDQHVSERHREHDLEAVVAAHPKLLGIGIDPNTIIVVQRDQFEVIGTGKVTITQAVPQPQSNFAGGPVYSRATKNHSSDSLARAGGRDGLTALAVVLGR